MRIPNVSQVLRGFGKVAEFQVIRRVITDHEVVESDVSSTRICIVLQPMKARDVAVKPEGQRKWRWLDGWSTEKLELDWTLLDGSGARFRIMSQLDWSQGGFYKYTLVEGPSA